MSSRRSVAATLAGAVILTVMAVAPGAPVAARAAGAAGAAGAATAAAQETTTSEVPAVQPEPTPVPDPNLVPVVPEPVPETSTSVPDPSVEVPAPVGDGGEPPAGDGEGTTGPQPPMSDSSVALVIEDRIRSGANSTAELLTALRRLTALGYSEQDAFVLGMGHFPVAGLATWTDDFHDPRYNPTPHYHQGTDIFAPFGVPVRAPVDGKLELTDEVVGGRSAYVTTSDGTYYYMTHLGSYATDLSTGDFVKQGRVVGYNGDSGNASGGAPHVHFEIHPGGGGAINPKPILDQWVAEALAAVPSMLGGGGGESGGPNPRVLQATGELRRFDVPMDSTSERAAKSPLLWSASVAPGGAVLRLAEVEAARMAQQVDWGNRAVLSQAQAIARHQSHQRAVNLLSRLTPPGLRAVLDGSTA